MNNLTITARLTNRENISFKQYLREIAEIKPFTPEEEVECAEKASLGDEQAREQLVLRNLRFVVSVAKQYVTPQTKLEDLVNEGNIGLITASKKFKPELGFRFISYAVWWIRKVIIEHLANYGRIVRLPANKLNSLSKLDKQIHLLEQKLGRDVSIIEVVEEFSSEMDIGFTTSKDSDYKKLKDEYQFLGVLTDYAVDSLDRQIGGEDGDANTTSLGDVISVEGGYEPTDANMHTADIRKTIEYGLNKLKPRDKEIMISLFGLDGTFPKSLKDVGDEFDITREMVRQIRDKSLKKLEKYLGKTELFKQ
jgi:RNA polymerase primary sigma factor